MLRLIKLIIWIFIISGVIFYINYKDFINETLTENKTISIKSWDNIVSSLTRELWFDNFYFKVYLNLNPDKKIEVQVWEYRLLKWENIDSIIKTINYWSMSIDKKLTLLEWWNIFDIDEYLTNQNLINPWEFISEAKNIKNYKSDFSFLENALTLEWYFYPDTYFVNPNNFSLQDLNKKMLENFKQKVYISLLSTLTKKQIDEVVILASILEREERNIAEKSTVAGILLKRYKENWMIGADITACYAYELTSEECKMQLSNYIYEKNEYNTRTKTWLPKTPINNPSFESVKATLNPKSTPYYYYLHDKNGKVYYAKTNEEHVENKKYMK